MGDLNEVISSGVSVKGSQYTVSVECFICDAPAQAYVKNIKYHSGYFGCDKHSQEGEYVDGRMTFPAADAPLRTDVSFDNMSDEHHHRGPTPLSLLNIALVTCFVIDYMHRVCHIVCRRYICRPKD